MSEQQIQATLHYHHGTSRTLPNGRIEAAVMPYAVWQCACGKNLENDNLSNSVLHTGCTCGRSYAIDWRHGLTPRVRLVSEPESQARGFQVGDRVRVVLNAEVIGLSLDREWLLLSPGRIWVPIDEFVERIMPEPTEEGASDEYTEKDL